MIPMQKNGMSAKTDSTYEIFESAERSIDLGKHDLLQYHHSEREMR